MTATELIKLLKKYEHRPCGRSCDISFYVEYSTGKKNRAHHSLGEAEVEIDTSANAELRLLIKADD